MGYPPVKASDIGPRPRLKPTNTGLRPLKQSNAYFTPLKPNRMGPGPLKIAHDMFYALKIEQNMHCAIKAA